MEPSMNKPEKQQKPLNDLSRSLTPFDPNQTLTVVIELSKESWLVGGIIPGVERQPLKKLKPDENELLRPLRAMAKGGREGRSQDRPYCGRLRGGPGRLLAGSLAEGARH